MVRFSDLMGGGDDSEDGVSETAPTAVPDAPAPTGDEPPISAPLAGSLAVDGSDVTLPPDSGTPTPASAPLAALPATEPSTAALDAPDTPEENDAPRADSEKAVNDDLLPRSKRRR